MMVSMGLRRGNEFLRACSCGKRLSWRAHIDMRMRTFFLNASIGTCGLQSSLFSQPGCSSSPAVLQLSMSRWTPNYSESTACAIAQEQTFLLCPYTPNKKRCARRRTKGVCAYGGAALKTGECSELVVVPQYEGPPGSTEEQGIVAFRVLPVAQRLVGEVLRFEGHAQLRRHVIRHRQADPRGPPPHTRGSRRACWRRTPATCRPA